MDAESGRGAASARKKVSEPGRSPFSRIRLKDSISFWFSLFFVVWWFERPA